MAKHIQAYFKTENQAEISKTTLLTYKTEHLEVSKLTNAIGRRSNVLIPLVANDPSGNVFTGNVVGVGSTMGSVTPGNVVPIVERSDTANSNVPDEENTDEQGALLESGDVTMDDYDDLRYVLVAKVEDIHYHEIVQKLRQNGAHIESLD
ncbi:hypothetical protein [Paenibacillus sp. IHBB 10380]|uniref:hypothetical protein n=1 Tax=Paenibacillus sp. IHBB 10380 TaxID=1566358 RepID=UPI0005CFA399|nr:hypothetical protein [Paenibacillus sp. IHBB 10380]AJS57547.1 hypothetical protein UB51_02545 [Paenibacillus sp. IHBB 10380]